jgi:predicted DCC family thiol-disulfide oxidoreductase YuxK
MPPRPPTADRPGWRGWLCIDPRSLGLGRIALGLALLVDLWSRGPQLTLFYSNEGLLPNHTVLWQPIVPRLFSIFFMASLPHEAALLFFVCGFCFVTLAVGFRTRLFQVLSLLATVSLHNRIIWIEGEGSVALGALCLWTLFLPLSRRFSVDAVVAGLRGRAHHSAADLDPARAPAADTAPVQSLAVPGLLLQFAAMLIFWFANRSGPAWRDGSALHWLLHQARVVTAVGAWARAALSPSLLSALSRFVWLAPLLIAVLLLLPVGRVWARRLGIALTVTWVATIAALLNQGNWAVAVLAFLPFFLSAQDWEQAAAWARRRQRTRLVIFDGDCGICFFSVRLLRRLDTLGRLRFLSNDDLAAFPAGLSVEPGLLEKTVLVVDPVTGRRWLRADAFAEIFRTLPGFWPLALFLRLPLVRTVAVWVYDRVAINRTRLSTWLGLAACGVPARPPSSVATAAVDGTAEASSGGGAFFLCRCWRWLRARPAQMRELLAALTLLALAVDALAENPAVPAALRDLRPPLVATLIGYGGLSQRWTAWASEPPTGDRMVFVDALTSDGRHVDPFNAAGSRIDEPSLPLTTIPARLDESALFAEYARRIPDHVVYHQAFVEWVLRHPERTGRAGDRIASFDAWVIDDDSPPPGETVAGNVRRRIFLHHGAPPP